MDAHTSRRYHAFADWARSSSPIYAEWAEGITGDDELTGLISRLGERRGQPNLVFAAARWVGCGLEPFAVWRDRLVAEWDSVASITAQRRTQTNEVGRCATLLPILSRIDGPVALPEDLPDVVWRAGIDLAPIDVRDTDAVAWLETLIWPGSVHDERVGRLRAAVKVARADPPRIVLGDILERLPEVAAGSPPDATLVVFHSAVLLYLDADERRRFADLVSTLGERVGRRVVWVSNETAGTLPEIDGRVPRGVDSTGSFVQTVDGVPVALAGQHGATYEVSPFRS